MNSPSPEETDLCRSLGAGWGIEGGFTGGDEGSKASTSITTGPVSGGRDGFKVDLSETAT